MKPLITVITSLYNCAQYLEGYFNAVKKITNLNEVEILLMHNAPRDEEIAIIKRHLHYLPAVKHIVISKRESLYTTWNKGVKLAAGDYITIWNVDDIRLPDSLKQQATALENNPEAVLAYGNIKVVNKYGDTEGRYQEEPEFHSHSKSFLRVHHIGCFPMWRINIHDAIGYFDEQFRLVADLDFQIRVARKFSLVKVDTLLGYYLENTASNLSSNRKLQRTERTALNVRYGNLDLLHLPYLVSSLKLIKTTKYKWNGAYHDKNVWTGKLGYNIKNAPLIFVSIFNLPLDTLRFIKYALPKSLLKQNWLTHRQEQLP